MGPFRGLLKNELREQAALSLLPDGAIRIGHLFAANSPSQLSNFP